MTYKLAERSYLRMRSKIKIFCWHLLRRCEDVVPDHIVQHLDFVR